MRTRAAVVLAAKRFACALAANGEPAAVEGALERRRTVGAKVDGARADGAAAVVVNLKASVTRR